MPRGWLEKDGDLMGPRTQHKGKERRAVRKRVEGESVRAEGPCSECVQWTALRS